MYFSWFGPVSLPERTRFTTRAWIVRPGLTLGLKCPPEMIEAGARALYQDPFLNLGPSTARGLAEEVLRAALSVYCSKFRISIQSELILGLSRFPQRHWALSQFEI